METTVRFICDKFEEIRLTDDSPVCKENFRYAGDTNPDDDLESHMKAITAVMMFQGITPVECTEEFKIIRHYPHDERKDGPAKCCRLCR